MFNSQRKVGNYAFDTTTLPITKNRFGGTYQGRDERHNRDVAVTVIPVTKLRAGYDSTTFQHKVEYLKAIRGPNVVQLYDITVVPPPGYIYVVTEACHHRELGLLLAKTRVIPEEHALRLVRHIASAILLIKELAPRLAGHNYGNLLYTHKHLTPSTIFLHGGRVKIAESGIYGLLEDAVHVNDYPELAESAYYEAPEVYSLSDSSTQNKADVWSLGVIFYQCLFGGYPFKGNTPEEMHDYLERNGLAFPDEVHWQTKDLLTRMLAHDPKSRINWQEILAHPAMQNALVIKREDGRRSFRDLEINLVTALENTFNEIEDPSILFCPHLKPSHERLVEKAIARDEYQPAQEVEEEYWARNNVAVVEKIEVIQVFQEKRETKVETEKPVEQTTKAVEPVQNGLLAQEVYYHDGKSVGPARRRVYLSKRKCNIF